jgi:hypothetical protein
MEPEAMNTALWMLYLADVASSASVCLILSGLLLMAAFAVWTIARFMEDAKTPPPRWLLIVAFSAWGVSVVIPGKQTFYAIAAANVGEKALQTQTGDKAVRALNAWLDRQIAGESKHD